MSNRCNAVTPPPNSIDDMIFSETDKSASAFVPCLPSNKKRPLEDFNKERSKKKVRDKKKCYSIQKRAVSRTPPPQPRDESIDLECQESVPPRTNFTIVEQCEWAYDVGERCNKKSYGLSPSDSKWKPEDFDIGSPLGRGKFGSVYRAIEKSVDKTYALKVLHKEQVKSCKIAPKLLKREVEIQTRLSHPNVLMLHGYFHDKKSIYLVLENASGGELYRHVMAKRADQKLEETVSAKYIHQLVSALSYLQSENISHRDIKPENLLLSRDQQTIKLSDFGWAIHAPPPSHLRNTLCGTPEYVPPEMLLCQDRFISYDVRCVDIWAIGVLALEMVRGVTPFYHENSNDNEDIFRKIRAFRELRNRKKGESKDFFDFATRLLKRNPFERMNVDEMSRHRWLQTGRK